MGQVNLCAETINPSCVGGGGNVAGGAGGEGFRSHRCRGLLYAWLYIYYVNQPVLLVR